MALATAPTLNKFFQDVDGIKDELENMNKICIRLRDFHVILKNIHHEQSIIDVHIQMNSTITSALEKAKLVKVHLQALRQSIDTFWTEPGTSLDRARTQLFNDLLKKLTDSTKQFSKLREDIRLEYIETVKRLYFTVIGEFPDDRTVWMLIATGQAEKMFQDAVQEQGLIAKTTLMQQRSDGLKDLEKRMSELHEVFSDMAVLIKVQGKHIYDVENQVEKAISGGTQPLANAKPHKRCTRTRILIVVIIIILISVILIIERKRVLKFLNPGHSY